MITSMNTVAIIGVSVVVAAGLAALLIKYKHSQEPVIHDNLAGSDFYKLLADNVGKCDIAHNRKVAAIFVSLDSPDLSPDLAPHAEKLSRMGAKYAIYLADYDVDASKVARVLDIVYCKQMDDALIDTFRHNDGIIIAD